MRSALALTRVAWLSGTSYRLATLMQFASVIISVVPLYFIATAVQDIAAGSIQAEGGRYFSFVVIGVASVYVLAAALGAVPSAIASNIGSGVFESLLVTRTPLPMILLGLSGYPVSLSLLRAGVLVVGGVFFGLRMSPTMIPAALVIVALMGLAYAGIGLVSAALIVIFRTSGPLITVVMGLSGLLGGAYYSTAAVPGWLRGLTDYVPLTYALRPIRMLLLGGASLGDVVQDVTILTLIAVLTLSVGTICLTFALRRARLAGTLSQY
jgi:ABC-2 type transport system permease protein